LQSGQGIPGTEPHLATDNEFVRNILLALLASLARWKPRNSPNEPKQEWQGQEPRERELENLRLTRSYANDWRQELPKLELTKLRGKLGVDRKTAMKYANA
jgi:hypothetical protein